jgi:hypothetical protein
MGFEGYGLRGVRLYMFFIDRHIFDLSTSKLL